MLDLKVIHSVLDQMKDERGIPKEKIIEAIELSLATAYKKEYGKKGQFIRAHFDLDSGKIDFFQVKQIVDKDDVVFDTTPLEESSASHQTVQGSTVHVPLTGTEVDGDLEVKPHFNDEHHLLIEDARKIKKDAVVGEELVFPLEPKDDFGRIAAQTAKQVIIQKIREAEKVSVLSEYGKHEGEIVTGTVQRMERGNIFMDMGRASGILPYEEQIPGERYKQGERVRMYLSRVEETPRGIFLRLSRAHPKFLAKLFASEVPEIQSEVVEIKSVAREAGARSKIAVHSNDSHIDPVGSMVGQRGVRVGTVMSELGGEKIDIIEWSEDPIKFIEESLSPAKVLNIKTNVEDMSAVVEVSEDQQSLAIGKGGQNVRLAAKLTGWRIDIQLPKEQKNTEENTETKSETNTSDNTQE